MHVSRLIFLQAPKLMMITLVYAGFRTHHVSTIKELDKQTAM